MSVVRKYGLIGKTLSHSFSKDYFEKNIAAIHPDVSYDLFELPAIDDLEALLDDTNIKGFNITIPYKEAVLAYADELSAEVLEIGASNTFKKLPSGKWKAYNTDSYGFQKKHRVSTRGPKKRNNSRNRWSGKSR